MRINARSLSKHLRAIACDGNISEVVIHGFLEARAITVEQILMVTAGPLEVAEPLPYAIGIIEIGRVIKMVDYMRRDMSYGDEWVDLSFDESRGELVVGCESYGTVHVVTADPWHIGTAMGDSSAATIQGMLPTDGGGDLNFFTVRKILSMIDLMKAHLGGLRLSSTSGRIVMEGHGEYSEMLYDFSWWTWPDCWLWFRPAVIAGVLKQVDNDSFWTMRIAGPEGCLVISNEMYQYVMSPEEINDSEDRIWEARCSQKGDRNQPIQPSPLLLAPATADVEVVV